MDKKRWIKTIDYIILFTGIIAIILLVTSTFIAESIDIHLDINIIPIVLITVYAGLNGVKLILKGNKQLGMYLSFFAVIVMLINIILRMIK